MVDLKNETKYKKMQRCLVFENSSRQIVQNQNYKNTAFYFTNIMK